MFKKENFKKLDNKYKSHAYEGLMGFFMKICHKNLEKYNSVLIENGFCIDFKNFMPEGENIILI